MAERVDSACDRVICCKFVRCVKVALPRVVALTAYCSTCSPLAAIRPLVVGEASGFVILSRSCLRYGQPSLCPPPSLQVGLADSPPGRGGCQLAQPLSPFQASEEDRRPEAGSSY